MKKELIFALSVAILVSCAGASASSFMAQGETVFDFNKQIMETIDLQLRAGGSYDDVISMLETLLTSFQTEQSMDTAEYLGTKGKLEQTISDATSTSNRLAKEVNDLAGEMQQLISEKSTLAQQIDSLKSQLQNITTDRQNLLDAKANSDTMYTFSQENHKKVLDTLITISAELNKRFLGVGSTGSAQPLSLIEKQDIISKLQNYGEATELKALIALSATFDKEHLGRLLAKLDELEEAIKKLMQQETDNKKKSDEEFKTGLQSLNALETSLSATLSDSESKSKRMMNQIKDKMDQMKLDQELKEKADALVTSTQTELDIATVQYTARTKNRTAEIDVIRQAMNVLQEKEKDFQEHTK